MTTTKKQWPIWKKVVVMTVIMTPLVFGQISCMRWAATEAQKRQVQTVEATEWRVRYGDSVWSLAEMIKSVTKTKRDLRQIVADIEYFNPQGLYPLQVGQVIKIPMYID